MEWIRLMLSGPYDIYLNGDMNGAYADIGNKIHSAEVGIFNIILKVAVYVSLISFLVASALMAASNKYEKMAEAKGLYQKTMLISALIFGIGNLLNLVIGMGLDSR